jgi:hypothetical protein
MKPIQPKDHPSFKRAIGLAHGKLLKLRSVPDFNGATAPKNFLTQEAVHAAMTDMAHQAYCDAVAMLEQECSRRAVIEYDMQGAIFIDEACHKMMSKAGGMGSLVAQALSASRESMPGHVRVRLEFGLREDGLIFGHARHEAIGGSFLSLQTAVRASLELLFESSLDVHGQAPDEDGSLLGPIPPEMRPALLSLVEYNLPAAQPGSLRPLAAHIDDLRERLSKLDRVDLRADTESLHTLTGAQASARMAQISSEANSERPHAASVSSFLSKLGI